MVSWIQGYYGLEPRVAAERAQDVLNLEHNVQVPGGAVGGPSFFLSGENDSPPNKALALSHCPASACAFVQLPIWRGGFCIPLDSSEFECFHLRDHL